MSDSAALLDRFISLHPKRIDLVLDRIERLLDALGDPHRRLPPLIHVAGTNGKGSTCAFLRAMLEAAGQRVHVYTSPHLVSFHERIRLAGRLVDEERLAEAFARAEAANGGAPITVFEITTAAAFLLFAEEPADALILEVGLGGRFDTTNVIERPAASIITTISFDHKEFLGDTIAKIAWSKAGIIKRGAPAVIGPQPDDAMAVFEAEAAGVGAQLLVHGRDFLAHEEHGRLVYQDDNGLLDLPMPRLAGRHQVANAAGAIAGLRAAFPALATPRAIGEGLSSVDWPARMQRLSGDLARHAPAGSELWLDGGHNPDGGRAIAAAFAEMEERSPKPMLMIVGMLATKETDLFLACFKGLARAIYAVTIPGQDHAARTAESIATTARGLAFPAATAGDLVETLAFIARQDWPTPPRILITGSLYLAGEALRLNGTPPK
jgi:dihydrofolate synthase / folylpolyglutamate synthase